MVIGVPSGPVPAGDYRRLVVGAAGGGSRRVVVVVHHADDSVATSGIEAMRALAEDGHVKPVLVASVSDSGVEGASTLDRESPKIDVLDALSQAGPIDRLDIVSVTASALLDAVATDSLIAATTRLVQDCRLLAPRNTRVQDCRIALPAYGDAAQVRFGGGNKRIVVVPEDRRLPSAMARPLDTSDPAAFAMHIAVETTSICGLWKTMDDDPLAQQSPADAKPELVRVARSLVRSARLICPVPAESIRQHRKLPLPDGAIRATLPQEMATRAAKLLVRGRLRPPPADQPPDTSTPGASFFKSLGSRVLKDLWSFPRRVRDGVSDEFERLVDDMAETMISQSPGIERLWDSESPSEPDQVPDRDHTPRPAEISWPDEWDTLVQGTLGIADRSAVADDVRAEASESRDQVLSSLEHLVGDAEAATLAEVFGSLAHIKDQPAPDSGNPGQRAGPVADHDSESDRDRPAGGQGSERADTSPASGSAEVALPQHCGAGDWQAPALLPSITGVLLHYKREARWRVDECRARLSEANPGRQREITTGSLSAAVPICLAFGALLAVLAWSVLFPPLRDILAIGDIVTESDARARLWILPTSILALALLVLNMPKETLRQQRYLIFGVTAITGVGASLLVWPGPVRGLVQADLGGSGPAPGIAALLVMAAMALCAVNTAALGAVNTVTDPPTRSTQRQRHRSSQSAIRSRAGRWSSALILLYLVAATVAVLNDDDSRPGFVDEHDAALLFISTALAAALILVSYNMVSLAWHRRAMELAQWRASVEWWSEQHQNARREADTRDAVYTHWLGTACALHRIIRQPYGSASERPHSADSRDAGVHRANAPPNLLVKAAFVECVPTAAGSELLDRILLAELVRPGWLYAQYRRAAEAYRSSKGAAPEACSYPLSLGEALLDTTDGDRWPFVQQLYRGDFDSALMERVTDFVDGDGLDELFDDVASFEIVSGTHADESPLGMLAELGEDPEPPIPPGVLDVSARIEGELRMKSYVWWPKRLEPIPGSIEATRTRSLRIQGAVVHQAVRVDLSEPIPLSALAAAKQDD